MIDKNSFKRSNNGKNKQKRRHEKSVDLLVSSVDKTKTKPLSNISYDKMLDDDYKVNGINRNDYFLSCKL